ncbi:uncharacterized protein LOC114177619 [Vigna unguiculata]|uniref:uncharacterized protein LOC114172657 n=1 Tax=Vigna unguiculata TaxID=3917 RepID=UPI001016FBAD|nr:uncharacterized protein LOC114172657 [Vigna unguiculata]XP_027918841.1 uncharacterized protein LOC114177619 [Vigna unguiculata]
MHIQRYIQRWIHEFKKRIYIAPYIEGSHWQLIIICPIDRIVVWFCSLHKKPSKEMKTLIQRAINVSGVLDGKSTASSSHLDWIYPKCNRQRGSFECGYYVMHWMWTIARATIVDSWADVFDGVEPLGKDKIEDIRKEWARYFLWLKH